MQRLEKLWGSLKGADNDVEQGLDESCEIETREPTPEEIKAMKEKEAVCTELASVREKMAGIWYLKENKEKMLIREVSMFPVGIRSFVKEAVKNEPQFCLDIVDHACAIYSRARRAERLADIKAPDIILRNEKRLLQEQVDAYILSLWKSPSSDTAGIYHKAVRRETDTTKGSSPSGTAFCKYDAIYSTRGRFSRLRGHFSVFLLRLPAFS